MTDQPGLDQAKMGAFVHKVLGDTNATMTTILAVIGGRLGLLKDLAAHGSATSDELASRMGINKRYAQEWLGGMASAGYLEAAGGMGLGPLGFHEPKVRELCTEAGFRSVRWVPLDNPFNNLYEIRP